MIYRMDGVVDLEVLLFDDDSLINIFVGDFLYSIRHELYLRVVVWM